MAREQHLLLELGRTLNNVANLDYVDDLARAAQLADEALAVLKRVGDVYFLEAAVQNNLQLWWLTGDWDRLERELEAWLLDHEPTSINGRLLTMRALVDLARGRQPAPSPLVTTDDTTEENGNVLFRALSDAYAGDPAAPAAEAAAAAVSAFGDRTSNTEDLEVLLAPAVELQLRAGDPDSAERLLALAAPLMGGRGHALTRAEVPRLRGLIAVARGEDAEGDFRAALAAHEAYGAPYLIAQTRYELARCLIGRGSTEDALGLIDEARATFARLGAGPALEKADALRRVRLEPSAR
jgi:tetratricopeptide (TPR) repeat protein